jgi:tetratricopeptide (TPR) repeat protein
MQIFRPVGKWNIIARFALLVFVIGPVSAPVVYAAGTLQEKYRDYQAEIKAGQASLDKEDYQTALEHYSRAIAASPFEPMLYFNRGVAFYKSGKLQLRPDDVNIQNNLAWLCATAKDEEVRDKLKALEHASRAAALSKEKNAGVLDTLGRAYFANGKVQEAIEAEKKAIALEPENRGFKDTLAFYERGGRKE